MPVKPGKKASRLSLRQRARTGRPPRRTVGWNRRTPQVKASGNRR